MSMSNELWRQTLLHGDATIKDAINVLNVSGLRIVLAVDENEKLLGTISDGDIRRGLLKGLQLENSLTAIWNHEAIVVPENMSTNMVKDLMLVNKIQQIPIVDENQRLIGLHLWDEFVYPVARPNIFVIMAGGKGTRLYPQTENCPKPMLLLAGKPILEHIILQAKEEGFVHFVLAINYLGHVIEDYFGNGNRFGVKIEYLREEIPLGTAGALSLLGRMPDNPIIVTNGDVVADIQYGSILDFHQEQKSTATMAVQMHEWRNPFGVVQTQGIEIIGYQEKPTMRSNINAGVYILEPSVLGYLDRASPCDMPTLFDLIRLRGKRVLAYLIHEKWIDVGQPEDLIRAQNSRNAPNAGL
jgi:dTDP-glucose pyrophosphorylase